MKRMLDEAEGRQEAVVNAVQSHGLTLDLDGGTAALTMDDQVLKRPWVWVSSESVGKHQRWPSSWTSGVFVLGDRIPPSLAERVRANGGWYADSAGNLYVRAPGVLVDVVGRARPRTSATPSGREALRATNLMSPGRAQVVFCLLSWPELVLAPVRYIAQVSGVSSSLAHRVLESLQQARYLIPGRGTLDREDELVDQWTAAFGFGLARSLELGRFQGEPVADGWEDVLGGVCVSGERATPALRGADGLTIYVAELDPNAVLRSRWRRAGDEGNIIVRRKFWTVPELWERGADHEVTAAPPLMVYADLMASGEPRQREIAGEMRKSLGGLRAR